MAPLYRIVVVHPLGTKKNEVFNNIFSSLRTDIWTPLYLWFAFAFAFGVVWLLVSHYLKEAIEVIENRREGAREGTREDTKEDAREHAGKDAREGAGEDIGKDNRKDHKEVDGKEIKKIRKSRRMRKFRMCMCMDQFTIIRTNRIRSIRTYAALAIFVLFFYWHYWFVGLFFTNSIKVNKVVVDDSVLIKNFDDVMRTDRLHCFIGEETELLLSQFSPPETVMGRIYHEKSNIVDDEFAMFRNKHGKCLLKMRMEDVVKISDKMFFALLGRSGMRRNEVFESQLFQIIELKSLIF